MKQLISFIASFINNSNFPFFFFSLFAVVLFMSFSESTVVTSRMILGGLLFLGAAVIYRVQQTRHYGKHVSEFSSPIPTVDSALQQSSSGSPSAPVSVPAAAMPQGGTKVAQVPQGVPVTGQKSTQVPVIHESGMMPTCAFMFNTNSANPSTFIIPDLACTNSLIMVPKELSQFYNNSVMDVVRHDNPVKVLRPVNSEYRKMIKTMALNDTKAIIDNGSLILPIHFFSNN